MGFLGFVLFFLFIWIIVIVVMSIFAILCIIFSALSAAKAKRFLTSCQYADYKSTKGRFIAALVFFIITCLTSAGALISLAVLLDGSFTTEELFYSGTLFFFIAPPALLIAAVALGIRCFVWYGRANKLNMQLSAAAMPPRFFSTAQGFKVCPICGSANDTVNSFCVKCGQPL